MFIFSSKREYIKDNFENYDIKKKRHFCNLGSINKISKKDFAIQIFRKLNINTSYDEVKINKFNVKRPLDMSMNCNKFLLKILK